METTVPQPSARRGMLNVVPGYKCWRIKRSRWFKEAAERATRSWVGEGVDLGTSTSSRLEDFSGQIEVGCQGENEVRFARFQRMNALIDLVLTETGLGITYG